jgi:hypothetical protein
MKLPVSAGEVPGHDPGLQLFNRVIGNQQTCL